VKRNSQIIPFFSFFLVFNHVYSLVELLLELANTISGGILALYWKLLDQANRVILEKFGEKSGDSGDMKLNSDNIYDIDGSNIINDEKNGGSANKKNKKKTRWSIYMNQIGKTDDEIYDEQKVELLSKMTTEEREIFQKREKIIDERRKNPWNTDTIRFGFWLDHQHNLDLTGIHSNFEKCQDRSPSLGYSSNDHFHYNHINFPPPNVTCTQWEVVPIAITSCIMMTIPQLPTLVSDL